jgi:hypothetical protein
MSSGISQRQDSSRECWSAGIINSYEKVEHHLNRLVGKPLHATGDHLLDSKGELLATKSSERPVSFTAQASPRHDLVK